MIHSRTSFFIALVAGIITYQSSVYAEMFRWIDSDGNIYYSDQVPPKQSKLERKVLSDTGRVVKTIRAAKTKEQIALEKRLQLLRKEQEKIIAKQKSNDKVLLSTFRNIDDLRMTLKGKLHSVDAHRNVHEGDLENLKDSLKGSYQKAARAERDGKKVPAGIVNEIAGIKEKIDVVYQDLAKAIEKRKTIQTRFDKDIERFLFLTTKGSKDGSQALIDKTAEIKAANTLGLFNCKDRKSCDDAWEITKQFVGKYSTTPINFNTNTLIMGSDPMRTFDISLSASKSKRRNKNKVSIFLDIRCHKSSLGFELCQSQKVQNIRQSFRPYIESKLMSKDGAQEKLYLIKPD